jgi:hypothetical protein
MARVSAFPEAPEQWLPLWLAIYLDDSCFIALALCVASWIERHFFEFARTFGIGLSLGKWEAEGAPDYRKVFLGVLYNWRSGLKSIPEEKKDFSVVELQKVLALFQKHSSVPVDMWRSCLFRVNHMAAVVPNIRLFLNSGFMALRLARDKSHIPRSPMLEIDIKTILRLLSTNGGRAVAIRPPTFANPHTTFYSDSSDHGVGGWHWADASQTEVVVFYGLWTREETTWLDITTLEGLGTLACFMVFDTVPNTRVLCVGDNFNITAAWNSAKSRSPLAPVLRELFCIQEQRQVSIETKWVRREDNEVADRLSKGLLEEAISLLGKPDWIRRPFPPEIHSIADRAVVCAKSIAESRDRPDTSGVRPVKLSLALRRAELE